MKSRTEELVSKLVSFPTFSPRGDERECAKYIYDFLKDLGIEDSEIGLHEFDGTRANVVASFGTTKEPGLLLSGHMDVVPSGDPKGWESNPFSTRIKEGKLFGRGTSDMKGGLAAMLQTIEKLPKDEKLKRKLVFAATAGEESGFVGLMKLLQNGIVTSKSARWVVIGEPTDLRPARAHRGIYRIKVNLVGKSSHASTPELGVNAIEYASEFIERILKVRQQLSRTRDELLGTTSLTPTMIIGGIGENVIPPSTEIVLDSRRLPEHSAEYVRSLIEACCEELNIPYTITEMTNHKPLNTPEENFLTKFAEGITAEKSTSCAFGTEGSLYWGELGLPTIVVGPGSVKQAHVDNEYVELAQVEKAISIYSEFVREICF